MAASSSDGRGWALISGASRGIGWRFAERAAAEGYSVFLLGRDEKLLGERAETLRSAYRVEVRVMTVDLSVPGAAEEVLLTVEQANLPIALWVNNAGLGLRGAFSDRHMREWRRLIQLNVVAGLSLTHGLLPRLAAQRGGMIHIASIVAFGHGPWLNIYYATKAFMRSFYETLSYECRDLPVRNLVVYPGPTRDTCFAERAGLPTLDAETAPCWLRWATLSAEAVVNKAWSAYEHGKKRLIPGWCNKLLVGSWAVMPCGWVCRMSAKRLED